VRAAACIHRKGRAKHSRRLMMYSTRVVSNLCHDKAKAGWVVYEPNIKKFTCTNTHTQMEKKKIKVD